VDAMRGSQGSKTSKIKGNITESENGIDIIEEGHGGGLGTVVIIPRGGKKTLLGTFMGKRAKDRFKENKASKEGAHRAALCVSFSLQEVLPVMVLVKEPPEIIGAVKKLKKREELREVGAKRFSTGITGTSVEHVNNV
jgi:hypothetical protein